MDKGTKLTKWTPSGRVSQRLTFKDRGKKSMSKKKKSHRKKFKEDEKNDKKLTKTESQIRLQEVYLQLNFINTFETRFLNGLVRIIRKLQEISIYFLTHYYYSVFESIRHE